MSSLRSIWIAVLSWLSWGVVAAPLPLLGCIGGLLKLIMSMNSGPLFALHFFLLLGLVGLIQLKLVKAEDLKFPARISAAACVAIAIPTVLCLATCSPEWIQGDTNPPTGITTALKNLAKPKGFTLKQWVSLAQPCPELDTFPRIESIFRSHLPTRGPNSLEAPFLNTFTSIVFDSFGNSTQTELKAYCLPVPKQNKKSQDKPGLLLFVHGGGWRTGKCDAPPAGCHAAFAMEHGWTFATVQYRLGRNGWSGDVQLQDVKDGIKHVLKKHGKDIDLSKVIVVSSSAGANLGLAASYQLNNEKGGHVIAAVFASAPSTSVEIGMARDSILAWKGAWDESRATARFCENVVDCHKKLSPIEHVTQHTPATILLHGKHDEYYTYKHSQALMEKLASYNVPRVHVEPPLMPHALELAENGLPYQIARTALLELMNSL